MIPTVFQIVDDYNAVGDHGADHMGANGKGQINEYGDSEEDDDDDDGDDGHGDYYDEGW